MMDQCLADESLRSILQAESTSAEADRIEAHLATCQKCQHKIERWLSDSDLLAVAVSNGSSSESNLWGHEQCDRIANRVRATLRRDVAGDLSLPCCLGDYELLEWIGEGGMGVVYRARQASLNRIVALKVIGRGRFGERSRIERFFHEAESAAMLNHPGIVPIYDVGEASGRVYYAMWYVPGGNLAQALSQRPYEAKAAAFCVRQIASAIAYAHEVGVVHRDLKPGNILLDSAGDPKIADFGLAKQLESAATLTVTGQVLGTPSYMPPEQVRMTGAEVTGAEVTGAADIYSLGAILFQLLTGRPPFVAAEPVDVLHQVIHDDPISPRKLNPTVPRDLETIALKCLAKQPEHRYASANALVEELDRYLQGRPIAARPMGHLGRAMRWCARNPMIAALSASVVAVLIIGMIVSTSLGILARQRAAALEISQALATKSANDARTQAKLAMDQADGALQILETMFFDLQPPYQHDASAQQERRLLLQSVLAALARLPADQISQARVLRCRATATLAMADTAKQAGDEQGLAGSAGSMPFFRDAIDLFEQLRDLEPDNVQTWGELAAAYTQCGDTYADGQQWTQASEMLFKALSLRRSQAAAAIDDLDVQIQLAQLEVFCGEALAATGDQIQGMAYVQQGYDRIVTVSGQWTEHRKTREIYAQACRTLCDGFLRVGRLEDADAKAQEYVEIAAALAREFPLDFEIQMEYSSAYERLADVSLRLGDRLKACEQYEESLRLCINLGIAAPDNDQIQFDVSFSYQKLADVYLQLGQLDKAHDAAMTCVQMRRRLVLSGPGIPRRIIKLNHALKTLARTHQRMGNNDLAVQCYQEAIRHCQDFEELTETDQFRDEIEALRLASLAIDGSAVVSAE